MFKASDLTQEKLRELFKYDPETGVFTWRVNIGRMKRIKAGTLAGGINTKGYWRVKIGGRYFQAHRLAWLYVHGVWPVDQIDHINGIKTDNRFANLRDVSHSVNQQNQRRATRNNNTGLLGVTAIKNRWQAQIGVDGTTKYLGCFTTPDQAHAAYVDAKRIHHRGNTI